MDGVATGLTRFFTAGRCALAGAAAAAVFASFGAPAVAAPFVDVVCPAATQHVVAIRDLPPGVAKETLYDALQAAIDSYTFCEGQRRDRKELEPMHYAQLRAAQFGMASVQVLLALHREDDARRALIRYRDLAQTIVDWRRSTGWSTDAIVVNSGVRAPGSKADAATSPLAITDTRAPLVPSAYQNAAQHVLDVANGLLARISTPAAASGDGSPAPH